MYVVRATFEPVEVDHLQLVITSVLYLVGDRRHFPSYSVWPTPWLMQFPRLPFSDGGVEQPNHFTIYKWLAMNFLIVKFLLDAVQVHYNITTEHKMGTTHI